MEERETREKEPWACGGVPSQRMGGVPHPRDLPLPPFPHDLDHLFKYTPPIDAPTLLGLYWSQVISCVPVLDRADPPLSTRSPSVSILFTALRYSQGQIMISLAVRHASHVLNIGRTSTTHNIVRSRARRVTTHAFGCAPEFQSSGHQ